MRQDLRTSSLVSLAPLPTVRRLLQLSHAVPVARLWLPICQAILLTDALTLVWKTALNQSRPIWQRTEVLVGALMLIGLLGLFLWGGRD